jgi:hypothetical protein
MDWDMVSVPRIQMEKLLQNGAKKPQSSPGRDESELPLGKIWKELTIG